MAPSIDATTPSLDAGASYYNTFALYLYDTWVLGLSNTYAWHCPTKEVLLPFFRDHMSDSHLDVGVGTGFFPASALATGTIGSNSVPRSGFGHRNQLTLVDLNPSPLQAAMRRVKAITGSSVSVRTVVADAMQELPPPLKVEKFSSISAFFLLHCIGAPVHEKNRLFATLRQHLTDDGVFFGATVLGKGNIGARTGPVNGQGKVNGTVVPTQPALESMNWFSWGLMAVYNMVGIFSNWDDEAGVFTKGLESEFDEVETWVIGRVFLFRARKPRRDS